MKLGKWSMKNVRRNVQKIGNAVTGKRSAPTKPTNKLQPVARPKKQIIQRGIKQVMRRKP